MCLPHSIVDKYNVMYPPSLSLGTTIEIHLTQDVSKCEKNLEMKKIDFSRSLSISKSTNMMKNGA